MLNSWIKNLFDTLYDGILLIDKNEIVTYVNPSYTRITHVPYEDIVGKHVRQIRPGAMLPKVLLTKEPMVGIFRQEFGIEYTVNMSPIFENSEIIGAISVVSNVEDIYKLYQDIDKYKLKIKNLENKMKTIQKAKYNLRDIISEDIRSKELKELIKKIAKKSTTVLINGESGTGKELYAHAIHNESDRADCPFIAVNCAMFEGDLLKSELFGYEEGSFTGAKRNGKMGLFEAANTGTIFLDEIGEMNFDVQAKFLRVLQEGEIRRVGGIKETDIDIRIITATNKNLEDLISQGKFREDLYYRISVFPLTVPPLRERRDDILAMANHFLKSYGDGLNKYIVLSDEAAEVLYHYDFPGNVRELKNSLEFAVNMMEDYTIEVKDLPTRIQYGSKKSAYSMKSLSATVKEFEKNEIYKVIKVFGDTLDGKKKAADALGISLASLYNKIKSSEF